MTNNQEKIQEVQEKIKKYFEEEGGGSDRLLAYQVAFLGRFHFNWERNNQEEKLALVKRILMENQEKNIEYTSFPPYCPTKLQGLLQEWLIIQLEVQFQAQIQQT